MHSKNHSAFVIPLNKHALFAIMAIGALSLLAAFRAEPGAAPAIQTPAATPKLAPGKYLAADAIDVRKILPDPAAPGTAMAKAEIEVILAIQADASEQAKARSIAEDKMTVWLFADVFGPGFNSDKMPRTAALLEQVEVDSKAISDRAKMIWARPRPSDQDKRIQVRTDKPGNKSYPSGHSTRAAMWAQLLTQFAPSRAEEIDARARLVGSDRIVAGVHYPSDVAAGFVLGREIAAKLIESPTFQHDFQEAAAEWNH